MLCLRRFYPFGLRCSQCRTWSSDPLLSQLNSCTTEDEVFDLVGKNKTKLSVKHVGGAISILWQFQKKKPEYLRNINYVRNHSQFLILRILAENKIGYMDNEALVDLLYDILRFDVEAHDSLVEELVMEGWRRLHRMSLPALSKFALCLHEQQIYNSPVMGHIADIVNKNLASIEDTRILSVLMISISGIISQSFRDRLIQKAEFTLETMERVPLNHARRFVQFLRNVRLPYRPLLDKCNKVFLQNTSQLDVEQLAIILGLYQSLQFNNTEFRITAKQKLMEMMDDCNSPLSFTRLFVALAPMVGPEAKEQLIETALLMADEFDHHQALAVAETMQEIECRNSQLIHKISSLLHKYLDIYRPIELAKVTQCLVALRCPNPELYSKLQRLLIGCLQVNIIPIDIAMLIRVLSMLPSSYMDEAVITRVDAILPQCNLSDLSSIAAAIIKWVRRDQTNQQGPSGVYGKLLQQVNSCATQRLQKANDLDLLLDELKYVTGEWFEEMLLEETMLAFQRLMNQITWLNVLEFSSFLIKTTYLCTPLLDQIAAVTLQDITKVILYLCVQDMPMVSWRGEMFVSHSSVLPLWIRHTTYSDITRPLECFLERMWSQLQACLCPSSTLLTALRKYKMLQEIIYNSGTYSLVLPFAILNYDPPQGEEFFETCIEHFSSRLGSFEPHLLVLLGFALAVAEYFPENLIRAVFNVEFLAKLDAQLDTLPDTLNRKVRTRLMELNRAVCLECPEFQIPWFHERYCQQLQRKGNGKPSALQQQIHKLLGQVLGGSHFAKVSVFTPYYYGIDFECILDKNKKPLPYMDQNVVVADLERVHWRLDGQFMERRVLLPGAQRIAVEFLDSKAFCKNSNHLKGEIAMKKRHLEILGYQVVQIPHFEWNSMELSSKDAWIEYLKKKIFEKV